MSIALAMVLGLFIVMPADKTVSMGIRPAVIRAEQKRNSREWYQIQFYGTLSEPETAKLTLARYTTTRRGEPDIMPIDLATFDPKKEPVIELSDQELTVNPDETKTLTFSVRIPSGVKNAEYAYAILFESLTSRQIQAEGNQQYNMRHMVAVPVIIHIAGVRSRWGMDVLESKAETKDGLVHVSTSFKNEGNRYANVFVLCRIYDSANKLIHSYSMAPKPSGSRSGPGNRYVTVYAGNIRDLSSVVKFPLKAGNYSARIELQVAQKKRVRAFDRFEFTVDKDVVIPDELIETVLFFRPIMVQEEIAATGSKIVSVELYNDHIEPLILHLEPEDPQFIRVSDRPIRLSPGQVRKISFGLDNPKEGLHLTHLLIKIEGREEIYRYPVQIGTR